MIVAILGYKHSGKSTLSMGFEARGFHRAPIATPLKEMLRAMGLTGEQLYGDEKEKPCTLLGGKTPRWAMQSLGTEWGREHIGEDVWIRAWMHTTPMDEHVVVDDLRFPNEALRLLPLGAYFIRVDREGTVPSASLPIHPSEAYVNKLPTDLVLPNNGTTAELWDAMDVFRADPPALGPERIASFRAILESLE